MKMLFSVLLLLAPHLARSAPAQASIKLPDAKTKLAIELIQATRMERTLDSMRGQMRSMMNSQIEPLVKCEAARPAAAEFGDKIGSLTAAALQSDDFKVDVAAIYAEVFSEDELRQMIEFYKSPLGLKMLDKMPELMAKSMQISQDRMKSLMPQIGKLGEEYGGKISAMCPATPATTPAKKK